MKAIKDCKWEVIINYVKWIKGFRWDCNISRNNIGIGNYEFCSNRVFPTPRNAILHFKEFAELNNITNYKIEVP